MTDLPDLALLLRLRQGLGIVHHVPGRIRLRLGAAIRDWARDPRLDAGRARDWLCAVAGVTATRLNPAAASLIVEYDPGRLEPDWWETLVLGDDDDVLALVLQPIAGNRS